MARVLVGGVVAVNPPKEAINMPVLFVPAVRDALLDRAGEVREHTASSLEVRLAGPGGTGRTWKAQQKLRRGLAWSSGP
eukprot:1622068-Rhodomonas_salina.2